MQESRTLAAALLVVQAGLDLLAALGLLTYARVSAAVGYLVVPELVAFLGAVALFALTVGTVRGSAWSRRGVYVWQSVTIAGNVFSVVASRGAALTLTTGLTGFAIPAAIVFLLHTPRPNTYQLRKGLIVGLLLVTALIHLALAPEHLTDPPRLGTLFILDALGFIGIALGALRETRWWRPAGMMLLLATILAYLLVVLRRAEAVDDLGVVTKLVELLALGLILWPRDLRLTSRWIVAATALVTAIVFSGGLAWAAALRGGATHTHAGAQLITAAAPTDAQRAAAEQLVEDTRAGIAPFSDVHAALAAGYRPSTPPGAPTVHYVNAAYVRAGSILDPGRPQALVYANTPNGPLLLGAMYMLPRANMAPPDVGGSIAEWHTHPNLCFTLPRLAIDGLESVFGTCPVGSVNGPTPAMLHVWTVANPKGPFADLSPAFVARLERGAAFAAVQ